ncbi:MAG: radical SAM protein [Nitrospirae bacterium]|nr:radical SAM protein [Nitrospirota bacterium]
MRTSHIPSYFNLLHSGELSRRAAILEDILTDCTLCPRDCRVDRTRDEHGFCRSGYLPIVSSYCAHFGEEPVLSGTRGSGTIFFGNCNLRCVFCQNHQISQPVSSLKKNEVSIDRLAEMMLELQSMGCHNINFVSPSHFPAQIVKAVEIAALEGLRLPLVYNTNGYDSLQTLKLLDGIIDIYLPDIKYSNNKYARQYSKAKDYVRHNRAALIEMKQQVGDLVIDEDGIAVKGILIRHLVLPNDLSDSGESLKFISEEIGRVTYLSTMSQYFPAHKAGKYPLLSRPIREREYEKVLEWLDKYHLENGWVQDYSSKDYYCPDFEREEPFKI